MELLSLVVAIAIGFIQIWQQAGKPKTVQTLSSEGTLEETEGEQSRPSKIMAWVKVILIGFALFLITCLVIVYIPNTIAFLQFLEYSPYEFMLIIFLIAVLGLTVYILSVLWAILKSILNALF